MNLNAKISVCQFKITDKKEENILKAKEYLVRAYDKESKIIVLPECFVCPYDINSFTEYSEKISFDINSPATLMLRDTSLELKDAYIFGGSIIEKEEVNNSVFYYNTCLVFYNGNIISKYRKNNLYKINIKDHTFCEADVLTPGNLPEIVNTKFGNIGIGICYDIRFPELAKYYQERDCKMIIYPGSFNRYTGPKHWLILQQVRALDNQLFIVSCSAACNFGSKYESWGKSYIISPWGRIIDESSLDVEEIVSGTIFFDEINQIKNSLPILF
tara:strand:+ start:2885 stop:3700 length:816 start_codon:yes stop_codon:yes gene_type:complete